MMKNCVLLMAMLYSIAIFADVKLPAVFSDHAVLQRSSATTVFGTASPGEKVTVSYKGISAFAVAGSDGKFSVQLDLSRVDDHSGDLIVTGNNRVVSKDVIVGEVWLCAGQSNMALQLWRTLDSRQVIKDSANNKIRCFQVYVTSPETPADSANGKWLVASPEESARFTGTGYYFARKLHQETGHPVGLINSSSGGTHIESWVCHRHLMSGSEKMTGTARTELSAYYGYDRDRKDFVARFMKWAARNKWLDNGIVAPPVDVKWQNNIDLNRTFPGYGVYFFRKEIDFSEKNLVQGQWYFDMGSPDTQITVFIDGREVKELSFAKSLDKRVFRFFVPRDAYAPGRHEVTVKAVAWREKFSFPNNHSMGYQNGMQKNWAMCTAYKFPAADLKTIPKFSWLYRPYGGSYTGMMWNGVVHPFIRCTIKGTIWYQGESNAGDKRVNYGEQLQLLVRCFREHFRNPVMPFYMVQLPGFRRKGSDAADTGGSWPELRAQQDEALKKIPYSGQAVIIDSGESDDIHPVDKKIVGERLALLALNRDYGRKEIVCDAPQAVSAVREKSAVRVKFIHAHKGLKAGVLPEYYWIIRNQNRKAGLQRNSPGSELEGFALCGKDGRWFWADARISGDSVIVSTPRVSEPVKIRYAWHNNPTCNLYNGSGLPAGPFELPVSGMQ